MIKQIHNLLPGDYPWQNQIHWYDVIDSTNTRAKQLAAGGAPHGTVLIADRQTGGRGRRGRSFLSPSGMGIYMSVILRPHCTPDQMMHLTCATAVAMCDAVEASTGLRPGIKWTNDLVHQKRKLAGILTELVTTPQGICAVVGIGINCCQREGDFAPEIQNFAGSLSMVTGRAIDRPAVAAAMLCSLLEMDKTLLTGKQAMMARYEKDCVTLGKDICLLRSDTVQYGYAEGIDPEGALLVRFSDGRLEAVNSGEVSVRGMYGYI